MTWVVVCDGPGCADQPLLDPFTLYAQDADRTEMHFCTQDCLLRWAARVPADVAAIERGAES